MSESKTLLNSEALQQYILDTNVYPREHELLKELRKLSVEKYGQLQELSISADEGQFLSILLKLINAKRTLEVGVFVGYSLLTSALALPEDGKITAVDCDREKFEFGLPIIKKAGVAHKIEFVHSDALSYIDKLLSEKEQEEFDFVFVDADKINYCNYHERLIKLVKVGGLIAYDNTLWFGSVAVKEEQDVLGVLGIKTLRDPEAFYTGRVALMEFNKFIASDPQIEVCQVPLGDGVTLCRRLY